MTFKTQLSVALYDAKALADKIELLLIEHDGEITPELDDLISFKDYKQNDLTAHVDMTLGSLDRLDVAIDYYKEQLAELQKLIKSLGNAKERLGDNLLNAMTALNLDALEGQLSVVKIQSNPPKVDVLDELAIPSDYKKISVVEDLDKKKIAEALKSGQDVPGARLISTKRLKATKRKDFDNE